MNLIRLTGHYDRLRRYRKIRLESIADEDGESIKTFIVPKSILMAHAAGAPHPSEEPRNGTGQLRPDPII